MTPDRRVTPRRLRLRLVPGLDVLLSDLPAPLIEAVRCHFRPQVMVTGTHAGASFVVAPAPVPAADDELELVLRHGPLTLLRRGDLLVFAADAARAWCELGRGRVGISIDETGCGEGFDNLAALALPGLFSELAMTCGWLAIHAAAVAVGNRAVLLPGQSGSGKTTIFRSAAVAGLQLLSDDLVWLREESPGFVLRPLERGVPSEPVPPPSVGEASLAAVVCPSIVPGGASRLLPLQPVEMVQVLISESSFPGAGANTEQRFRHLVRLASQVPGWRLEAGPNPKDVIPLLRPLLA